MGWDPEGNIEEVQIDTLEHESKTGSIQYPKKFEWIEISRENVMQYVGIQDKHNKEIYDQDIVAKETKLDGFSNGREYKTVAWHFNPPMNGWNIAVGDNWEVIGNMKVSK